MTDATSGLVVDLTGLPVASPIAFMAALGLLRVAAQDHSLALRLSWSERTHHACLHGISRQALMDLLVEHMRERAKAPEFNFEVSAEKGRRVPVQHLRSITPHDYRLAVAACQHDARALGFLAGYGTDAIVTNDGCIGRTRLDFSSGQQKLVEQFRRLAADLDPQVRRPPVPLSTRIERALFGGPYEERHSLGWDPATLMSHAHQPAAPTDSTTPGQPMMVWLAVEALPLHPVLPTARGARTAGFAGTHAYVWPQWSVPLDLAEVSLLRQRPVDTLAQLPGVAALWSSAVTSVGKYGFLLPAARTGSVGAAPQGVRAGENA